MRLIDADAFKTWIDEYVSVFKKSDKAEIKGYISHQPSIDIVRCGECKWCDDAGKKRALICTNPYIDVDPHPNFFCGYGEREGE